MSAGKAYQAMAKRRLADNSTPHKLSVNDMISIIESMNDPRYIVYQGGNGRYVEVINYNTEEGKKAFAILEIGENKDAVYMNGYEGGLYNILVTAFPPEPGKLQKLLKGKDNEVIYDKQKDLSQRTSGSMVPSVLNDKPFYEDIVTHPDDSVNTSDENPHSDRNKDSVSNRSLLANSISALNTKRRWRQLPRRTVSRMFKLALNAGHYKYTAGKRCHKDIDPKQTREWVLNDRICDKIQKILAEYDGIEILRIKIDPFNNKVDIKPFKVVSSSSWLKYGGYAAQKMLLPSSHAPQVITLCGRRKDIKITM